MPEVAANSPPPITATIITLNEADNIQACIESVQPVCDEVIVVDSGSSDDTIAIARNAGAKIIEQPYLGDGPQKAVGAQHAANEWILSIDADERLEEDAVVAIQSIDLQNTQSVYAFRRRNFVGDQWIKAAGFYPDYVPRLYYRQTAAYSSKKAHARVTGGRLIKVPAHIRHYTYKDFTHWAERINQLSSRDAWAKNQLGVTTSPAGAVARAAFAFLKKLILKGGIFQGSAGWTVAITTAFHVYLKYMKLIELRKAND